MRNPPELARGDDRAPSETSLTPSQRVLEAWRSQPPAKLMGFIDKAAPIAASSQNQSSWPAVREYLESNAWFALDAPLELMEGWPDLGGCEEWMNWTLGAPTALLELAGRSDQACQECLRFARSVRGPNGRIRRVTSALAAGQLFSELGYGSIGEYVEAVWLRLRGCKSFRGRGGRRSEFERNLERFVAEEGLPRPSRSPGRPALLSTDFLDLKPEVGAATEEVLVWLEHLRDIRRNGETASGHVSELFEPFAHLYEEVVTAASLAESVIEEVAGPRIGDLGVEDPYRAADADWRRRKDAAARAVLSVLTGGRLTRRQIYDTLPRGD